MKSALLVIDVQDSFLHREFWSEQDFPRFTHKISQLISGCVERGIPVVDVFHESTGAFDPACGWVKRMSFLDHDAAVTVRKRVHNALTDSSLLEWLRVENTEQLIISGMRTEQCCETTARVASDLGFKVLFVSEAMLTFAMDWQGISCSAETLRWHTEMVLSGRFATVCTVAECLQQLDTLR